MTEEDKLYLAQPLTDIYISMETDLMMAIAEQIARDGEISPSTEWRLRKLAEAGALTKTAMKIIASYTGIQSDMLSEAVEIAALDVINGLEPAFAKMAADGLVSGAPEVPASVTAKSIVSHYRRQAATDLNLVNTVMQYKAVSSYKYLVNKMYDETKRQEALNNMGKHTLSVVTGAESRQQAVRNCIREFSRNGIPAFVDKAGREWSPEAYVNMDIRTTVSNTAHAAQDAVCDRYDIDLIEISSHMGARPKCAPYQGKVFSRRGQSGVAYDGKGDAVSYSPLSETSYGQPDGIFGINCRHKKYPFVSGASFRTYFPYDEEENAERYKATQKQRYMERRVREASREAELLEIAGDEQGAKEARLKAKNRRAEYRKYCSDNGLKVRNDRLAVVKNKS